jgi:GT2 family glycosyltransferase
MIRVIIVTYNSQEDVKTCLKQLTKSADYTLDITVVDSNSTDGTLKYIRNAYPQIDIIKCDHNGGYAYANNIGISKYLGSNKEPKAFLILNPDATISTKQIAGLYKSLSKNKNIGGVSPIIIDKSNNIKINYTRTLFGFKMKDKYKLYDHLLLAEVLHGSCMLIKPELLRTIGFFDESFFLYAEETEFCGRAIKANYILLVNTDIEINHSLDIEEKYHTVYYTWRNIFLFTKKQFDDYYRLLYAVRRLIVVPKHVFVYIFSKRFDLIHALFLGLLDGFMGKTGKSTRAI